MELDIENMTLENMDLVSNLEPDSDTHIHTNTYTHTYNGLNDYGNYGNYGNRSHLYNPMIHRGFQNSNSDADADADADAIYTLHNYLLALNLNTSHTPSHTSIHTSIYTPCGLSKKELEKNSTILECSDSADCPICLCNYPQHTYFYVMKCTHSFCIDCCETWFSKNSLCPLCRKNYKL